MKSACKTSPLGTRFKPGAVLLSFAITLVRRLLGAGRAGSLLIGLPPNRSGGVAVTPAAFSGSKLLIRQCSNVVSGVGTEFQLWVLSTIVMLALVFV